MKHLTLEAKAVATDLGEFTAIAAAYSIDRVGDRIVPGAFTDTIKRWQDSGKQIPLHWDHSGDPADIIGTIDPASVVETASGLQVSGKLDIENSDVAKEAWRVMKSGSMGLSFGYLVLDERQAKDGVNDLLSLDLFEFSIAPGPANFDTRVLAMKSMSPKEIRAELAVMRGRLDEMEKALTPETEVTEPVEDAKDEEPEGPTPEASDGQTDEIAEWDTVLLEAQGAN